MIGQFTAKIVGDVDRLLGQHFADDPKCDVARVTLARQHAGEPAHPHGSGQAGRYPRATAHQRPRGRLDVITADHGNGVGNQRLGHASLAKFVRQGSWGETTAGLPRTHPRGCECCGVDQADLADMVAEIKSLNPKPGERFEANTAMVVVPDILMRQTPSGGWAVELNPDTLPRLLVNRRYYAEINQSCRTAKEREYLS